MMKNDFPVYLINLEHDLERKEDSIKQLHELEITPIVIPACNGHQKDFPFYQYQNLSRGKWWDKNVFKPGAFACYLSHAKCWKEIAMSAAPYTMILEDDMIINKEAFQKLDLHNKLNSFDIIFINQGVTQFLKFTSFNETVPNNSFISLNETILDLFVHNEFNNLQPGSYGYIVSKKGANKLLQIMEYDKICMGVDYAMIFNSLNNNDIERIKKLKEIPYYLQIYLDNISNDASSSNHKRISLDSYICTLPALVTHNYNPTSSIKHEIYTDFNIFNKNNDKVFSKLNFIIKKLFRKKLNK